jgi:hypothetical protein
MNASRHSPGCACERCFWGPLEDPGSRVPPQTPPPESEAWFESDPFRSPLRAQFLRLSLRLFLFKVETESYLSSES